MSPNEVTRARFMSAIRAFEDTAEAMDKIPSADQFYYDQYQRIQDRLASDLLSYANEARAIRRLYAQAKATT